MKEVLQDIAQSLKDHNKQTAEILRLWQVVEERNQISSEYGYVHYMASAFVLIEKLRKEYNEVANSLVRNQDDLELRETVECLRQEFINIAEEIFSRKSITLNFPTVPEIIEAFNKSKEENKNGG